MMYSVSLECFYFVKMKRKNIDLQLSGTDTRTKGEWLTGCLHIFTIGIDPAFGPEAVRLIPKSPVVCDSPRGDVNFGL